MEILNPPLIRQIANTVIYAKSKQQQREPLCENLKDMSLNINVPLLVAGDFNCILSLGDKKGREDAQDVRKYANVKFIDTGYIGSTFTWCRWRRRHEKRIWERLDRALINAEWSQKFNDTMVLISFGIALTRQMHN
ncbi:hypothetical protein R3W88_029431 [Solanum pinnatisectum]|uniref:Endonuclease/exonuclease/phosphatase domain-containing protein n=1 Tax=Solanum pinnatisectum TaxID=50273 RepID=A0AAV9K5A5_9SOLN|nr:hypothetical protein R3W88_029431 [Solanum pinnatisectum]